MSGDALTGLGSAMFDDAMMAQKLPSAVVQRFNQCLITGDPTPEEDQKVWSFEIYQMCLMNGRIFFEDS